MMRRREPQPFFDDNAAEDAGASRSDAVGPQGAALILELQRLRQAFDEENPDDRRSRGPGGGGGGGGERGDSIARRGTSGGLRRSMGSPKRAG
jgi:hypothetical protein